jgi:hypothetical protein
MCLLLDGKSDTMRCLSTAVTSSAVKLRNSINTLEQRWSFDTAKSQAAAMTAFVSSVDGRGARSLPNSASIDVVDRFAFDCTGDSGFARVGNPVGKLIGRQSLSLDQMAVSSFRGLYHRRSVAITKVPSRRAACGSDNPNQTGTSGVDE